MENYNIIKLKPRYFNADIWEAAVPAAYHMTIHDTR